MQTPQQNAAGQTFDERINSKSDQRDAASKYVKYSRRRPARS
jgi:hypothetical protein